MSAIRALISRRRDRVLARDDQGSGLDSPASSSIKISNKQIWVGSSRPNIERYHEGTWGMTKPIMFLGAIPSASRLSPSINQQYLICGFTISLSDKKATNHLKANQKIKAHTESLKKLLRIKSSIWIRSDTRCPSLTSSGYPSKGLHSSTTIRAQFSFPTKYREQIWTRRHTRIKDFCSRTCKPPVRSNNTILTPKKPETYRKRDWTNCNHKYRIRQAIRALSLASRACSISSISKTSKATCWQRIEARGVSISDWRTRREETRKTINGQILRCRPQDNFRTIRSQCWFVILIWRIDTCESQRCSTRETWAKTPTSSVDQVFQIRASLIAPECMMITFKVLIRAKSSSANQRLNWEVIGWTAYFLTIFWKHLRTRAGSTSQILNMNPLIGPSIKTILKHPRRIPSANSTTMTPTRICLRAFTTTTKRPRKWHRIPEKNWPQTPATTTLVRRTSFQEKSKRVRAKLLRSKRNMATARLKSCRQTISKPQIRILTPTSTSTTSGTASIISSKWSRWCPCPTSTIWGGSSDIHTVAARAAIPRRQTNLGAFQVDASGVPFKPLSLRVFWTLIEGSISEGPCRLTMSW